jgi:outer membrane lipoprotein carrier protein
MAEKIVMRCFFIVVIAAICAQSFGQNVNPANDPEAAALLQKVSEKYKGYKNISANFLLFIQRPKLKPEDDDRKYVDTLKGQIILQAEKFKISVKDQQVFCDGKNIWTYVPADKEVQLNTYEESEDMLSPSKIFTLYKSGYLYNIKEKKTVNGHNVTVIEMAPPNKKLTYFKIDVTIDDASLQLLESKVFEKNGVRYIYKLNKQTPDINTTSETFMFDAKKNPAVKVVDLR